jgi:ABC-type dipeptide/oligopeptide/nickel transport system permease subunit
MPTVAQPLRSRRLSVARLTGLGGNRLLAVSLALVGFVLLVVLVGVFWTPYPADEVNIVARYQHLSWSHPMGTDELGRDILSRVMVGGRTSLAIATGATAAALLAGGLVAIVVGYLGGWLDLIVTRIIDILLAVPALLIALGIVAIAGPTGLSVAVSLAVAYAPTFARVIRSGVVAERDQPYVEASRGLGAGGWLVVSKDILPNIAPMITVQATSVLAWAILDEANLGFLGLGVQPPTPSWGSLLIEGRVVFYQAPWLPICAGAAVLVAVLGVNLLGDALRDVLDPRASRRSR